MEEALATDAQTFKSVTYLSLSEMEAAVNAIKTNYS